MKYVALLRGINVGGKNIISMADLKQCFGDAGFTCVRTYINSGNVLFVSPETDGRALARRIEKSLEGRFGASIGVALLSEDRLQGIIDNMPDWWGGSSEMKYNLLVLMEPYDIDEVVASIGELKPEYEKIQPGDGVIYQALSWKDFGKTVGGKLASKPVYKRMTVRNYNTSRKLLALLKAL